MLSIGENKLFACTTWCLYVRLAASTAASFSLKQTNKKIVCMPTDPVPILVHKSNNTKREKAWK